MLSANIPAGQRKRWCCYAARMRYNRKHAANNPKPENEAMTRKQLTQAIQQYARRHGYYARTVRTVTSLRLAAIREAACK